MNIAKKHPGFSQTVIALAVLAAFGPAHAEDGDDLAQLTKPESSVSVGVGAASGGEKDRALFGQYNGLRKDSVNLLLDLDYVKRNDATGTWTTVRGRNLGLDNRELGFSMQKQGDWKFSADYNEITRHDPRTINTGMLNAGTTTPTVNLLSAPGTGSELNLELRRKGLGFGVEKWLTPSLQLEVNFKNEDKDGARLFGKGYACASSAAPGCAAGSATATGTARLFVPEPIDSSTKQVDAKLNYSGEKLMLSGGYYGSFYNNMNGTLTPTVPGTLNNPLGTPLPLSTGLQSILQLPMALPPDNQAHQLYLSGSYAFTPKTRSTFKLAYTHATQDDNFLGSGLTGAPAGRTSLDGVLDTTLAQFGLTARPMPKLFLLANLRYEDKKDRTPIALYNLEGTNTWTNGHISNKKIAGKAEASYQLPLNVKGTLGGDYESIDRGTFVATDQLAGLSGIRQKTEEIGYRAELRRAMSETLTGAISYGHSRRDGSSWLKPNSGANTGVTPLSDSAIYSRTAIFPMIFTNRTRDKVKLLADWMPMERLSLQFAFEDAKDDYSAPTTKGLQDSGMRLYSIDAAYTLSDKWKLNAYWSQSEQTIRVDHSSGYQADIRDKNDTLGLGVVGKPTGRLDVGANLSYINDRTAYGQTLDVLATTANQNFLASSGGLPDVTFRQTRLNLFTKYALDKKSDIRLDFIHQQSYLNEWTWGYNGVPFAYSDNTTISMLPNQRVSFIGITYIYKMQ